MAIPLYCILRQLLKIIREIVVLYLQHLMVSLRFLASVDVHAVLNKV
jgi:hypothetical protein